MTIASIGAEVDQVVEGHLGLEHLEGDGAAELSLLATGDRLVVLLDAPHDAIRAGCGRHLDAIALGCLQFRGRGQIDSSGVEPHVHRFNGARDWRCHQRCGDHNRGCEATRQSQNKSPGRSSAWQPAASASPTMKICKQSHPAQFKYDIAPISRLLEKSTSTQSVSTILPI